MTWAKVPDWLLDALVERRTRDVAPGTALAAYVVVALRANFRTGEVRVAATEVAAALAITPRSARRALAALEAVGALRREPEGRSWVADAGVRPPDRADAGVRGADAGVPDADVYVLPDLGIVAGEGPHSGNPQTESFSEGIHLVESTIGEQMELSAQRAPKVVGWLQDREARIREPILDAEAEAD